MMQEKTTTSHIGAVVMAAGLSQRMGKPKMILPWGKQTVIEKVVATLLLTSVDEVVVVTGGVINEIKAALGNQPVQVVLNPDFADGIMLNSLRIGLKALNQNLEAVLIALGDNPQIEDRIVEKIISEYKNVHARIIVPSYELSRGHPWLVDKSLWQALIQWDNHRTLRDFLNQYSDEIHYLNVDTPSVVMDLDTPEDYENQNPGLTK